MADTGHCAFVAFVRMSAFAFFIDSVGFRQEPTIAGQYFGG